MKDFNNISRDNLVIKIISFFWIIAKLRSIPAWTSGRQFPIIPFFSSIEINVEFLFYSNVIGIILLTLILIRTRFIKIALLVANELILICADYIFMQPWEYIYLITFILYLIYNRYSQKFIYTLHVLICSIYILSAIHKMNRDFLVSVWNKMILNDLLQISQSTILDFKLFFFGLAIPLIEIALGLGLLLSKKKIFFAYLLMVMHILILIFLGPTGLNYNSIIWFWNILMIILLFVVYRNKNEKQPQLQYWNIVFLIIPAIFVFTGSKSYATFNLYSGKNEQINIYNNESFNANIPYNASIRKENTNLWKLNVQSWAMLEILLPPNPEKWYTNQLEIKLKKKFPNQKIERIP